MTRRPPRATRTYTLFPYPTLVRSARHGAMAVATARRRARPGQRGAEFRDARARRRRPPRRRARCGADRSAPGRGVVRQRAAPTDRSEEHTSELQSLMRISYAVFCLKQKKHKQTTTNTSDTVA